MLFVCICKGFAYSDNELNNIELRKYGQVFDNESLSDRLSRLETDFFGMAQSGNIDDRVYKLSLISGNSRMPSMAEPYYNDYPKKNIIKTFFDNVASDFSDYGTMTGFTPSITTYGYGNLDNLYRNEFLNFMDNSQRYCPYHNKYHTKNHILNRNYHNPFKNSRNLRHNTAYNGGYRGNYPINGNYNRYNRQYFPSYQSIPDISTRSSVHIIRD